MILCAGEALIDMIPNDDGAFTPHSGGAVFNTAIALGRLGAEVGFFSGFSNDFFGDQLLQGLSDSHVGTGHAFRADRPSTLAFVQLIDGQASYAFYDENTAGRMLSPDDLPGFSTQPQAAFFGGISLIVEPCAAAYESLMMQLAGQSLIMIDPNIRPTFIRDPEAYRARLARMLPKADIVKLSDEDLHWLMGEGATKTHVNRLLADGTTMVIITRGAKGATAYLHDRQIQVASQRTKVVDTVGAGDTFNAGILAWLQRADKLSRTALTTLDETQIEAALSLGAQAAAVTVSRAGANPPWQAELPPA